MTDLSIEDKGKGKRIITQFFRTMPGVQKSLLMIFERDGYEGTFRLQSILYPNNSPEINSIDTLRKGLSMILQHIYGMPVEDKEGYFQELVKCKTADQVVQKEKETLVEYFYNDLPDIKKYLLAELLRDKDYRFITKLCKRFINEDEEVSDMRSFKNQIRNIREALRENMPSGGNESTLLGVLKEQKQELDAEAVSAPEPAEQEEGEETAAAPESAATVPNEKAQIIMKTLGDAKYSAVRDVLLKKVTGDQNFALFQHYLDNISPSPRLVAKDLATFAEGVKRIKEFRDHLEKELVTPNK